MKGILYELYRYAICEPGVDEWNAPPLNASNLNDISNALQAVNITQQERTTLGAEATDTLGQILAALKNTTDGSIESIGQDIEEIQQTMGNTKYEVGSYVGNGTQNVTLTFNISPKYMLVFSSEPQIESGGSFLYYHWVYDSSKIYNLYYNSGNPMRYGTPIVFNQNTFSVENNISPESLLNKNGVTVYYIVFG